MKEAIDRILNSTDRTKYTTCNIFGILNSLVENYPADTDDTRVAVNYDLFRLVSSGAVAQAVCLALIRDYFYWEMYKKPFDCYPYSYMYPYIWDYCNFTNTQIIDLIHKFPRVHRLYDGKNQTIKSLGAILI